MDNSMSESNFDHQLAALEFYADPHPVFHQLREQAPVYWSEAWGAWLLTRYDDVSAVLRQADRFSSAGRVRYLLEQLPSETRRQVSAVERHYEIGLAHSDPPDHTRLRALLNRVFTPRMIEERRPRIQRVVDDLLDQIADNGQMDIIADFAYPLPATIIAEMIGAPSSDIALFRQWATDVNRLFELGGRIEASSAQALQTSLQGMKAYIAGLVAERQRQPQDDILGRLVAAEEQADKLTLDELASTAVTFFVAGHETTTNLIGNGLLALLRHPDQLAELRDNPALINSAVEEMLRYDPSVPRGWRIATQDVEMRGKTIRKGALLFPILSAANRDPEHFPDPDRFDIRRQPNRHLAFGYGIHFCLGAPLARLEAEVAVNTILRRFPDIQLADAPLTWRRDIAIRSLNALNVVL
jgi:hypothetical protein